MSSATRPEAGSVPVDRGVEEGLAIYVAAGVVAGVALSPSGFGRPRGTRPGTRTVCEHQLVDYRF